MKGKISSFFLRKHKQIAAGASSAGGAPATPERSLVGKKKPSGSPDSPSKDKDADGGGGRSSPLAWFFNAHLPGSKPKKKKKPKKSFWARNFADEEDRSTQGIYDDSQDLVLFDVHSFRVEILTVGGSFGHQNVLHGVPDAARAANNQIAWPTAA